MHAVRNLLRRKIRTALTVLGVSIGVATVVALIAVAKGLRTELDGLFAGEGSHLVLKRRNAADPFLSYLPDTLVAELAGVPGVEGVYPFLFGAAEIPENPVFITFGVSPGSPTFGSVRLAEGEELFATDDRQERRILLGRQASDHLEVGVGERLTLADRDYLVCGVYESELQFFESGGFLAFADAQHEAGLEGKMSLAMVALDAATRADLEAAEARFEEQFPKVDATRPGGFTAAFEEFDLMDEAVLVMSILATLIGGIAVMNTMLMSVFERTREIGILQAVGWSRAMILRQVLAEAALVCLASAPVGVLLGIGGVEAVGSIGEFGWLSGDYGPVLLAQASLVGLGMGLVGAAYPAWRATRIPPIEALRYE